LSSLSASCWNQFPGFCTCLLFFSFLCVKFWIIWHGYIDQLASCLSFTMQCYIRSVCWHRSICDNRCVSHNGGTIDSYDLSSSRLLVSNPWHRMCSYRPVDVTRHHIVSISVFRRRECCSPHNHTHCVFYYLTTHSEFTVSLLLYGVPLTVSRIDCLILGCCY
jgi:hypothetical protein